ncbi:hypothetical protein MUP38_07050 [Candidatus Bathyarchaeota archaeon]|nr:hypothetical protein [Candidatus Bathyarchaeota archaeon]
MVAVTPNDVRGRLNISVGTISDAQVTKFLVDAAAEISAEIGQTLDYSSCTQLAASAITNLAAIYCANYVSGGATSGQSFTIGTFSVSQSSGQAGNINLDILNKRLEAAIKKLKNDTFKVAESDEE